MLKQEPEESPVSSITGESISENQQAVPKIDSVQSLLKCVLCENLGGEYVGHKVEDVRLHASLHQDQMQIIMAENSQSLSLDFVFGLCFPNYSSSSATDNSPSPEKPRVQLWSALTIPTTTDNTDKDSGDKSLACHFVYEDISPDESIDSDLFSAGMFTDNVIPSFCTVTDNDAMVKAENTISGDKAIGNNTIVNTDMPTITSLVKVETFDDKAFDNALTDTAVDCNISTALITDTEVGTDQLGIETSRFIDQELITDNAGAIGTSTDKEAPATTNFDTSEYQSWQFADEIFRMAFGTIGIWCHLCSVLVPAVSSTDIHNHVTLVHVSIDDYHQGSLEEVQTWQVDRQEENQVLTKHSSKTDTYILDPTYWLEVKKKLTNCFGEENENLAHDETSPDASITEAIISNEPSIVVGQRSIRSAIRIDQRSLSEPEVAIDQEPSGNTMTETSMSQGMIESDQCQKSSATANDQKLGGLDHVDQEPNSNSKSKARIIDQQLNEQSISEIGVDNGNQIPKRDLLSIAKKNLQALIQNKRNNSSDDTGELDQSKTRKQAKSNDQPSDALDRSTPAAQVYQSVADPGEEEEMEQINKNLLQKKAQSMHKRSKNKSMDKKSMRKSKDPNVINTSTKQKSSSKSIDQEQLINQATDHLPTDQSTKKKKKKKSAIDNPNPAALIQPPTPTTLSTITGDVPALKKSVDKKRSQSKSDASPGSEEPTRKKSKNQTSTGEVNKVSKKTSIGDGPMPAASAAAAEKSPTESPAATKGPTKESRRLNDIFVIGSNWKCLLCGEVFPGQFQSMGHARGVHQIINLLPPSKKTHCDPESSAACSQKNSTELVVARKLKKANNGSKHFQQRLKTAGACSIRRKSKQ